MWWWQSQAPTGAFSLAGSLPDELGAVWARPGETPDAVAAKAVAPLMKLRRAIMRSSPDMAAPAAAPGPSIIRNPAEIPVATAAKPVRRSWGISLRRPPTHAPV